MAQINVMKLNLKSKEAKETMIRSIYYAIKCLREITTCYATSKCMREEQCHEIQEKMTKYREIFHSIKTTIEQEHFDNLKMKKTMFETAQWCRKCAEEVNVLKRAVLLKHWAKNFGPPLHESSPSC